MMQRRIRWMEIYYHGNTSSSDKKNNDLKALKQELVELLEEDAAELLVSTLYVPGVMISSFLVLFFVLTITFCLVSAGIFKANTTIGK